MMVAKTHIDYAKDYTKPHLREQLKEKIKQGDKGGQKGQWSARKAQLLNHEYEKAGGQYKHSGKQSTAQKSLSTWTAKDITKKGCS
ncbi:MAG: hypothetical protein K0Q57_974 [Gammaproteobacteria bacterium]|jgi:hypothetical protein|nr:hypothetical protein [Gammaproteobacteria bacterium]